MLRFYILVYYRQLGKILSPILKMSRQRWADKSIVENLKSIYKILVLEIKKWIFEWSDFGWWIHNAKNVALVLIQVFPTSIMLKIVQSMTIKLHKL